MAAITNQASTRKQIAMQRAEGLTDIWDVFKAWMGRAAEIVLTLCMFAQLIGMLPGVSYPGPTNSIILGVELIMLDFGAFALAPLAEHARNIGQDDAAIKAEAMATWLIRLVMTTIIIVIVGQFSPIFGPGAKYITGFVKYAEPVLILVRVGFIVKYIHVIHSLRSSTTLEIEPTQPGATLEQKYEEIEKRITSLIQTELKKQASNVDYHQLAQQLTPVFESRVSAIRTTIIEEIRASASNLDTLTVGTGHHKAVKLDTPLLDSGQIEASIVDSEGDNLELRIRALLTEDWTLSGRAIAARVGCSPTTASGWKKKIEAEKQ